MPRRRVALVGFRHEAMISCPFLTGPSTTHIHRRQEMRDAMYSPAAGALARLDEERDYEAVPLLVARSLPGGPFERSFYDALKAKSLTLLQDEGPFDGIVVLNHGAAEVDGLDQHGDTDYILAIRATVGDQVPIAVPFDMHGQVTPSILDAVTVLSCLRTAPHRDYFDTSYRAADQLVRVIRERLAPVKAAVRIPLLIPGEMAMTAYSPTRELFAKLARYDARPGVMEAHLFVGFGWNDRPWAGMEAVVVCEERSGACGLLRARACGRGLGATQELRGFHGDRGRRDGSTRAAAAHGPIYLSDSGDNVTAGAGGDLTFVLQEAVDLGLGDCVVGGIYSPESSLGVGRPATDRPSALNSVVTLQQPRSLDGRRGRRSLRRRPRHQPLSRPSRIRCTLVPGEDRGRGRDISCRTGRLDRPRTFRGDGHQPHGTQDLCREARLPASPDRGYRTPAHLPHQRGTRGPGLQAPSLQQGPASFLPARSGNVLVRAARPVSSTTRSPSRIVHSAIRAFRRCGGHCGTPGP